MDNPDLLRAIYTSATDYAIITMDNSGIVTSWNAGAERILGYRPDEIIGRSGSTIFTADDQTQGVRRMIAGMCDRMVRDSGAKAWSRRFAVEQEIDLRPEALLMKGKPAFMGSEKRT